MRAPDGDGGRDPALDLLRAGAAALVLLSHARALLIRDAGDQQPLSAAGAAFFALSGLGHQAVIVFFVLSGLLVTGAMLRLGAAGRWSLGAFATARLVRLWIVLAPCLAGGALLDRLGLTLSGGTLPYGIPPLGHPPLTPALDPLTAGGNLLFLQTVAVPVLGSNGPLGSLANEAWYYVVAAGGFAAWQARRRVGSALPPAAVTLLVLVLLPRPIVALAPVWLCGAAVALIRHRAPPLPAGPRRAANWLGIALLGTVLPMARLHHGPAALWQDLALGLAIALLLLGAPTWRPRRGGALARRAADASYSLYLSHVPVLSLFAAVTVGPERLLLGPRALLLLAGGLAIAGMAGWAVWWAFERHTDRLRGWIAAGQGRAGRGALGLRGAAP